MGIGRLLLSLPQLLGDPAGLAVVTFHLVENPGRFAAALRRSAKANLVVAGVASAVTASACMLLTVIPVPVGQGPAASKATILALPSASPHATDAHKAVVQQAFAQVRTAVAAGVGRRATPVCDDGCPDW